MVSGYFDDTDSFKTNGMMAIAGYLFDDNGVVEFGRKWEMLLVKHKISRLHTSDFLSGNAEYKNLSLTYERRVEIVREFIEIIRQHVLCGIAVAIDGQAYKRIFAEEKKMSPQQFCFMRLLTRTLDRAERWQGSNAISVVFDDSEHSMRFYKLLNDIKLRKPRFRAIAAITFGDDTFVTPLQAADLLACISNREHRCGGKWENSPFIDIFKSEDPAYGLLYEDEYWDEIELQRAYDEVLRASAEELPQKTGVF